MNVPGRGRGSASCPWGSDGACQPDSSAFLLSSRLSLIVLLLVWTTGSSAANGSASSLVFQEYAVKAAFLYNFVKFVQWPTQTLANPSAPLRIGVLGKDPFGSALESLTDKTVRGRTLIIKRFKREQALEFCHILFISASEKERVPSILESLGNWSVLTVGEVEQFAHFGGIINLAREENRIRLEINVDRAEQVGLKISSKLLKLARVIRNER